MKTRGSVTRQSVKWSMLYPSCEKYDHRDCYIFNGDVTKQHVANTCTGLLRYPSPVIQVVLQYNNLLNLYNIRIREKKKIIFMQFCICVCVNKKIICALGMSHKIFGDYFTRFFIDNLTKNKIIYTSDTLYNFLL